MKKAMALIAACILALAALSVSAEESPVTGDWYTDMGGMPVQLTLAGDGSYTLAVPGGDSVTGTWVLDDGYIYMDGAAAPDMATMGGDMLVMSDGMTYFTREKIEGYAPAELRTDAVPADFAGYWQAAYVDVNGTPVTAYVLEDETDLYVEGSSAILGGPVLGDTQVKLAFGNGAFACESGGAKVQLQMQQDGYLRLTAAGTDGTVQTWYLIPAYSPALDGK